ncbi:MAG TPA: hypothetical protein VKU89_10740 [Solirubrobacteraceae bacterium]|nr:hypothetical protein [Solirubrobacteraceae bacterium]
MAAEADNDLDTLTFEPLDGSEAETRGQELPPRPRRRLLTPLTVALLVALAAGCGFIGGVQVQKGESSGATSAGLPAGIASRLGALRSARSAGGAPAAGFLGGAGAFLGGAGGGLTTGEVADISGSTLYVTTSEGNTVKVSTAGAKVTKTVATHLSSIHPGDAVLVRGAKAKNGAIEASSISISPAAAGTSSGAGSSGGTPALFGAGG